MWRFHSGRYSALLGQIFRVLQPPLINIQQLDVLSFQQKKRGKMF